MKKRLLTYKLYKTIFCFVAFMFLSSSAMAQVARISNSGGNWNDAARWTPNGVPTALDDVTIAHNVTINANNLECANLTVNAGVTLNHNSGGGGERFTVNGNFIVNGTYNQNNNAGRPTYIFGDFIINGTYTTSGQGDARQHIIMRKGGATIGGTGAAMSGSNVFCHLTIDLTDTSGGNYVTLARNITIGAENNSPNLNLTNGHLLASGRTITSGSDNNLIINANNGYNFVSDASYCSDQKGPNLVINGTSGRGVEVNGTLTINNLTFTSNNASFPRNTGAQITVNGNFSRTIENSPTINAAFNWGPESSYSVSNTSWSLGSSPRGEWNGVINANAPATINSVVNEAKVPCGRTVRVTALASDAVGATAYRLRAYNLECGAGNYAWGIGSTTLTSTGNDTYDVYTSGTYWVACSDLADPVSTNPLTITPRISSTSATNEAGTTTLKAIGLGAPNDDYEWGVGTTCGTTPRDTISESNEYSVMISSSIVYWARKVENPCNNGVTSATISFTIPKDFTSSKGFSFCEGVSTILTASGMGSPTDVYRWTEQKLTPTAGPVVILSERTVSIEVLPSLLPDYSGTIRYTVENLTTHETESRVITLTDCCGTTGAFSVSQVCNPITVDATRDEAEWSISPTMPISSVNYDWGCTTPNPAGEWKMLYDDDGNVYMYIRVFDRGTPVPPSGNRWESSSAEIYFEAGAGCEGKTLQLGIPYSPSNPRQYLYNNIDCGDWELKVEDIAISAWNGTYWDIEIKFNAGVNQFDFTDRVRMEVGINRSITGTNRCAQFFTWTSGSTDVFTNIGAMRYVTTTAACTSVRSNKKVACEGSTVELNTRLEAEPYAPAKSTAYTWQYCTGTNCTNALADDGNWLTITGLENTAEIVTVTAAFGGASSIYYRALYNKSDGTKAYTCPVEVNKGSLEIEASSNVSICEGGNITIDGSIVTGTAWLWGWKKGSTDDYTQADEWVVDLSDEPADMTYSKTGAAGDTGYYFFVAVGQCEAASQGVQVTVNNSSQADLRLTPTSQQICSGSSSRNITIEGGTASTFDWRIVVSGGSLDGFNASQTGTAATSISGQQLTLASGEITAATITYYITPNGIDGCSTDGSEFPVTVTVNTKPTIEIATSNTPVCEGETLNLQLTTNGTSYIWTGPNNFTSSDQNPSISNVTTEAVGTYKIVVSSAAGCKDSTTTLVAVNPKPTLTNHMAPDHCSGELHAEINLTSLLAGATFSWTTATTGNIVAGFTTSAIGVTTIPAYEYVTLSATATDTVIYRITPTLNQCAGDEIEYKIPVKICQDLNLEPEISSPICKDETTIVSIVAGNHAGVVANDVTVQLEPLPAGLEYVSTIKGTYSSATRIWTIGTIPEKVGTVPGTDTLKIVVRGIAAGNNQEILSYISYANSGSIDYANYAAVTEGNHKATNAVTVDALPTITPITGGDAVCVGKELQLSSTPTGGTWKIVNSTATGTTINGSSGLLTAGSTAGTLTVRYIVTNISGCVDSVALPVTVNDIPIITPITGGDAVCVGKEMQLSSTPTGGTWKIVNNTAVGTAIDNSSLLIAGNTAGTLTVRYIVTNISGCVDSVSLPVTINALPTITPITGGDAVCLGKDLQLSSTPSGGTWKIVNNTAVGTTIDNSGLLTADNTVGTLTVRYIVTNVSGCVDSVALTVTVNDCKSNPPSVVYHTEDCQSDPECDEQPNCWQTGDCANGKVPAPYGHYNACAVELGGKIPFAHLVVVPDRAGLKFYNVPTGGTPLTNAEDLGFNPSVVGTTEVWVTYTEPEPHKTESERIKLIIKVHQSVEDLELIYEKLHHDNTGYVSPGQEVVFRAITTASGVNYTWTDSKNANLPNAVEHALRLYKDYKITVSVANNICPAVTKTITVPVVWPTAITPYDLDGYNDDFLVGTDIFMTIFNRYGQKVYEGRSGWDGTYRGKTADPGTYYYVAELPDGDVKKGAIEVVRMK